MYYGAIEAGGTKMVCAVGDEALTIIDRLEIPTTLPEETLERIYAFFDQYSLCSMGVGSFGPIGINPDKDNYGYILATPKKGWTAFDLLGNLKSRYSIPFAWTTDVNAAAYGEMKRGAAKGKKSCIYLTVGTGIGAGVVIDETIFQGLGHPEMGHIRIRRADSDRYEGTCPYHRDCLEGLAAGPSLETRTGTKGENLPEAHPAWELQAYYIAQALMNYTLTLAPEKIILGGGVMNQGHLLHKIRRQFIEQMAGYMDTPEVNEYIVRWQLANESGIIGCLLLAKEAV
ncbi:ROK family protein [Enterococcus sp. BWB1-3]|uniref:ROK family protein n=1 Tax=Enterococcus sp. BWB1-3 TaxID=2787713 RepID=UPI0019218C56|nr:ROK family protein [Enterococcus sp. BWB1-3]MBL1228078.1 ROK family protein [Enterococcus sp. BWB1-3]